MYINLDEIRQNPAMVNDINWEMTPEEAVTLYLEWGNNWTHGKHLVKSKTDVSVYFVVNTWDDPPCIYLIRRNSDEAVELGKVELPAPLRERFLEEVAHRKGIYAISAEIRAWLEETLQGPSAPKPV